MSQPRPSTALAALLSIVAPGAGHAYLGRTRAALTLAGIAALLYAQAYWALGSLAGVATITACDLLLRLVALGLALRVRDAHTAAPLRRWATALALPPVLLGLALGAILASPYKPMRIVTAHMQPTLQPGDQLMIGRVDPQTIVRGDLVVYRSPRNGKPLMMRVVGMPGETIATGERDVTIDGQPLDEPWPTSMAPGQPPITPREPTTVPEARVGGAVAGVAEEVPAARHGPVAFDALLGKALYVVATGDGRPRPDLAP